MIDVMEFLTSYPDLELSFKWNDDGQFVEVCVGNGRIQTTRAFEKDEFEDSSYSRAITKYICHMGRDVLEKTEETDA